MKKYYRIYKHHGGGLRGLKRAIDTFTEIDLFDIIHKGINTRTIKTDGYQNNSYMWYAPVYTSVSLEMIKMSLDYFASAIRYTNFERKIVFVDLGCGSGKTIIQAHETNLFDYCGGVELNLELKDLCENNLIRLFPLKTDKFFTINGNVEESSWALQLKELLIKNDISPSNATIFIFNKNSYDGSVLDRSLKIAKNTFNSIIYLYQNPIHHKVLLENNFECFLEDSKPNNAHKNYKYKCYLMHKIN
jgi:hypothetical protein